MIIFKDIKGVNIKLKLRKLDINKICHHVNRHRIFYKHATKHTEHQPLSNFFNNSISYSLELNSSIPMTIITSI